jgi:hypothetical protein
VVARTHPQAEELVVVFMRDAVEVERHYAVDGHWAAKMTALMAAAHDPLQDGDIITIMRAPWRA